jgi:hypothetical protein
VAARSLGNIRFERRRGGDVALAPGGQAFADPGNTAAVVRPDLPSVVARATMYLQRKDAAAAIADLDAANRLATSSSMRRWPTATPQ